MWVGKSKLMNTFKKVTQFFQCINYKKKICKTEIISSLLHLVSFYTLSWASHSTGLKPTPHTHKPFITWILSGSPNATRITLSDTTVLQCPEVFSVLQVCQRLSQDLCPRNSLCLKGSPPASSAGLAFCCYLGFRRLSQHHPMQADTVSSPVTQSCFTAVVLSLVGS